MENTNNIRRLVGEELAANGGLLRFAPNWVARNFMHPGRRLKLDPRDYYAYGGYKGGIDERWFASTTPADNGEFTIVDEGLSWVVANRQGQPEARVLFRDVIAELGAEILGQSHVDTFGGWTAYSKFFDNMGPIAHHVHPRDEHAAKVKMLGKPEAYYFPPQQNNVGNNFPHTYFGLNPEVTKSEVEACLRACSDC